MENDPVYDAFNLKPVEKTIELMSPDKNSGDIISDDLDEVRSNTKHLIEVGEDALQELRIISKSSQDPKAYRELSTLIKVMADVNEKLLEAASKRKELSSGDERVGDTINNNLIMTTTEAIELLRKNREEEKAPNEEL